MCTDACALSLSDERYGTWLMILVRDDVIFFVVYAINARKPLTGLQIHVRVYVVGAVGSLHLKGIATAF